MIFKCPGCNSLNTFSINEQKSTSCSGCLEDFPVLNNSIPILLKDSSTYLFNWYSYYDFAVKDQKKLITRLSEEIATATNRKEILEKLLQAITFNNEVTTELRNSIYELIPSDFDIENNIKKYQAVNYNYPSSFEYLKRDWCWEEGEEEIGIIKKSIQKALQSNLLPGKAVVLGAGAGRLGVELAGLGDEIIFVDNSFTMACWYNFLSKNDLYFYDIKMRNVQFTNDLIRKYQASISKIENRNVLRKINYIISEATELPLEENSVSSILSIYFTDVIPLNALLKEVKRVLKSGGIFVHFGPLNYHFKNITSMFAAEEVKEHFLDFGFEMTYENKVKTTHLQENTSIKTVTYENLIWVFKKK
jgi:carnosine N-methyltransferase